DDSTVYSVRPNGTVQWGTNLGSTLGAFDGAAAPSFPVASSDGNEYIMDDTGNVWKLNDSTGSKTLVFTIPGAAGGQATVKVDDANHNLIFGGGDGNIYSVTTGGTQNFATAATGSTQTSGPCNGKSTAATAKKFVGEAALDGAGNIYIASADNPPAGCPITLGTLYKVNATTGAIVWAKPLVGKPQGAVIYTGSSIIADTAAGQVAAFDTNGNQLWSFLPSATQFLGNPAYDAANNAVYVADALNNKLYGLNATTGAVLSGFPVTTSNGGTTASPIVDAAGHIYILGSNGTLYAFSNTGASLFTLATGVGTGYGSAAIDARGIIYVGGNNTLVHGYLDVAGATATAAAQQTSAAQTAAAQTATAAAQQTSAVQTATAGANANNTATAQAGQTQTSVAQTSAAQTAAAQTATAAAGQTQTSVAQTAAAQTSAAQTAAAQTSAAQQTAAAQTAAAQQTAAAATALAGGAPNCQLIILPNPETIQRGGSEAILFKALPNTVITATIDAGDSYPLTATLYSGTPTTPGTVINGTNVGGTAYQFVFSSGNDGRALLDFPIPATAPLGKFTVTAVAGELCAKTGQSKTDGLVHRGPVAFNVEAQQASSFGLREFQSLQKVRIRSVEPPPASNSVVTDRVRILTAPGAVVTTTFVISGSAGSLGAGWSNGQSFFQNVSTASATGVVHFGVPISSTLLIPGKGGVIKVTVQSNTGGKTTVFRTSKAVREVRLRLVLQPQETTRGNKRSVFQLAHKTTGTSLFAVLALCDPNASASATASFPSDGTGTNLTAGPNICGPGGRTKFKFNVPNSVTAPTTGHNTGLVTVTSTYRGATITRSIKFTYSRKKTG
ncbi:MAG TPA: PQQ-binding-like beta-propeller repeat protein, partial [Chloroflexota bacterium]|nr:PQQ-binding-like beta-propeller repeat protein [Chloroflexota bacterium]